MIYKNDYFLAINTVAYAEIPSSRPVKPNFSVVVALMDMSALSTDRHSAITACIFGICGFILGLSAQIVMSAFPKT